MLRTVRLVLLAFVVVAPAAAFARDDIRVERVRFERGASSAVVEDSIPGDETVDYVLGARKGQMANISMATDNGVNYFNILAPGENEVALFNGSKGKATGCDAIQADPGEFHTSREGDLDVVRIGDERYEIPDAVVSGG